MLITGPILLNILTGHSNNCKITTARVKSVLDIVCSKNILNRSRIDKLHDTALHLVGNLQCSPCST